MVRDSRAHDSQVRGIIQYCSKLVVTDSDQSQLALTNMQYNMYLQIYIITGASPRVLECMGKLYIHCGHAQTIWLCLRCHVSPLTCCLHVLFCSQQLSCTVTSYHLSAAAMSQQPLLSGCRRVKRRTGQDDREAGRGEQTGNWGLNI